MQAFNQYPEQQLPWFIAVMESIRNDTISVYNSLKADFPHMYMYSPFLFTLLIWKESEKQDAHLKIPFESLGYIYVMQITILCILFGRYKLQPFLYFILNYWDYIIMISFQIKILI